MGDVWKALADPTRRKILSLLKDKDMNAGEIANEFNMTKPSISNHLNILKQADLVDAEKVGQNVNYSLKTSVLQDDKFPVLAADDIRRYLEDYAEHEPNSNLWQSLLGVLETEQRARATREARKIRPCPACGKPLEIMSIADSWHSPGGFDVIAHCRNCLADYEWFCDKDGGTSDMKQYFFG